MNTGLWPPGVLFAAVWFVLLFVVGERALTIAAAVAFAVLAVWLAFIVLVGRADER